MDTNYKYDDKFIVNGSLIRNLSDILNCQNSSSIVFLSLKNFYFPYQRIMEDNRPNPLVTNLKKNVTLILEKTKLTPNYTNYTRFSYNWYLKEEKQKDHYNKEEEINNFDGIEFLTFTDLYSVATFGYDVITFYISFIFVFG